MVNVLPLTAPSVSSFPQLHFVYIPYSFKCYCPV